MPIRAIVLTQTDPQKTKHVWNRIDTPTWFTMGQWDAVTIVEGETPKHLSDFVIDNLRNLDGVKHTETMPILTTTLKPARPSHPIWGLLLIKSKPGMTQQVFGTLTTLAETHEVHTVAGRYDIVATFGASSWDDFGERVLNRIHSIKGISTTETALIVN